ncbi:MAG: ABC transporter ATP-binding protein [Candidatus Nanopelagicaceae bacterium]|jgi:NitT/TauT family transport system ATP-binding protein
MSLALNVEQVYKRFNDEDPWVLEDLNLKVKAGEFIALVGASGCGKSTLLNLISNLDEATSGKVETNIAPTLMFQDSALLPWLSAGKNVELPMQLKGLSKEERVAKAKALLASVNLDHAYDKRPHELSGGMRQRVAIARALAQESKFLLMDEPFAALDAITRDLLHDEIIRLWQENGLTVIFVTHNVREAVRLGQRVLLMSSRPGRFVREWQIDIHEPRRIDSPDIAVKAREITDELRNEIRRHANA